MIGRALAASALLLAASDGRAQSGDNVLLVINTPSAASVQIGEHYARVRGISQDNVLRLSCEQTDQINRIAYERQIESPISAWISRNAAHDRILYIVLTKGVPLRVAGTDGRSGTIASVDSELTLLYRKLAGRPVAPQGSVANPYFLGDRPIEDAKPFTHETFDIYLVSRLDGFSVADAIAMVDRGMAPVSTGRFALDEKFSIKIESGNKWLERSAERLRALGMGDRVVLEATSRVLADEPDLLGYYSWGSNDPAMKRRALKLGFVPGALAATFVSGDGRTFTEPPATWTLGTYSDPKTFYAGSPQSLIGDLIRDGATGVAGHVAEPYLDGTIRPDVLFPAYVTGFNLIESFYLAMPYVSWQTVVVGDPLVAPFRKHVLTTQEIQRGIDPATELPALFAARVLQPVTRKGVTPDAAALYIRSLGRITRGDMPGAKVALEQSTAADAKFADAQFLLGSIYEQGSEFEKAVERYRRVVALSPSNVLALNNLAYTLAVRLHQAGPEALALAQRAYTLGKANPAIADTLAWILHLSGNDADARGPMIIALRGSPDDAQIELHAAIIDAAVGAFEAAARELARAVELDPQLEKQPEVQQLRAKLGRPVKPPPKG